MLVVVKGSLKGDQEENVAGLLDFAAAFDGGVLDGLIPGD